MKRLSKSAPLLLIGLMLGTMTSCENGNLFGRIHKSGDSGDTESLLSDAAIALRNQDYGAAVTLYQRVLDQNPNDAGALYGAAAAALGVSGLNLGQLISNMLQQTGSAGVSNMADLLSQSRESYVHSSSVDPNSILAGINISRLKTELPTIKSRLEKIVRGATNLKILPDDIDVLVNLAAVLLIDAVVVSIDLDMLDVKNTNGSYAIVKGSNFSSACSNDAYVKRVGSDLAVSYYCLNRAVIKLALANDKILARFLSDITEIANQLLDPANTGTALPTACLTSLSSVGIDKDTYKTYSGQLL